jgi:hypothetical protein
MKQAGSSCAVKNLSDLLPSLSQYSHNTAETDIIFVFKFFEEVARFKYLGTPRTSQNFLSQRNE